MIGASLGEPRVRRSRAAARVVSAALGLALAAGCARPASQSDARPESVVGGPCDACAMPIDDARFACERRSPEGWRLYDSIECLIQDGGSAAAFGSWLADHETRTLHRSDSMWVVKGGFQSPMGGGLAAFLSRASADTLAAATGGRVARLAEIAAAPAH